MATGGTTGAEAVAGALDAMQRLIDADMPRRVIRPGILAGLRVLRVAIAAAAPVGTKGRKYKGETIRPGALKRSIGSSLRKQRGGTGLIGKAGIDVGKRRGRKGSTAPHGHLVALGTTLRFRGRKTKRSRGKVVGIVRTSATRRFTGRMTPNPFVRSATASVATNVLQVTRERILSELERDVKSGRQATNTNLVFDL